MLDSIGLNSAMDVDSAATSFVMDMAAPGCEDGEIGSSPTCYMQSITPPARLRGGGRTCPAPGISAMVGPGAQIRYLERRAGGGSANSGGEGAVRARLTLRGGGNAMLAMGSKYSAKERALNKQLCGAVKRGDEKEIKRLVKEASSCVRLESAAAGAVRPILERDRDREK